MRKIVEAARTPIILADGQPLSAAELAARQRSLDSALINAGYQNFETYSDIRRGGALVANVTREVGLPSDVAALKEILPSELRDTASITLFDKPVADNHASHSGMVMNACTAGFSVIHANTNVTGVSTAGHCGTQTQITHPGSGNHTLTLQQSVNGYTGDMAWYTTNSTEPPQFYYGNSSVRTVLSAANLQQLSPGTSVCFYSRLQQQQRCSTIWSSGVSCTIDGVLTTGLVAVNDAIAINGDSGSGWYSGTKAYGITKGQCSGRTTFQPSGNQGMWISEPFWEAMGVHVLIGL